MRLVAIFFLFAWSTTLWAEDELSRDEARAIAESTAVKGGVNLGDFELLESRQEPSGEWSFEYKCTANRPDCQFYVIVNSSTGRATITSQRVERRHRQTSSRTEAALSSTTKEQCEVNNGTWFKSGMTEQEFCDIAALDAGKSCTDSVDCESTCVTESNTVGEHVTGYCDKWHHSLGRCVAEVKDGVNMGGVCVD
jgi:hypothetical protein